MRRSVPASGEKKIRKGMEVMEFEKLQEIIAEVLNVDADEITMETTFVDDLGADSLDAVELGMAIEEETGVAIADEDLPNMKTVKDLVDYVTAHQE